VTQNLTKVRAVMFKIHMFLNNLY